MEVLLKGIEANIDGESMNVRVEIYQRQTNQSIPLVFKVKKEDSLDSAVRAAERMLRDFGQDFYSATSVESPLLRGVIRH